MMNGFMEYKGFIGSIEYSENDGVFFGKVHGIDSLISYEGNNEQELIADFHGAVDDYLAIYQNGKKVAESRAKNHEND